MIGDLMLIKLAFYERMRGSEEQGRGPWVVKRNESSGLLIECQRRGAHIPKFMMPTCVSVLVHRARVNEAATRHVPPSSLETNTPTPKK